MIWLAGIGGALGAAVRYFIGTVISKKTMSSHRFPIGTWIINITGSFLLGLMAQAYLSGQLSAALWYVGGVGFCGAYTTFSTFGVETLTLLQSNKIKLAALYVITSIAAGATAAAIGFYI